MYVIVVYLEFEESCNEEMWEEDQDDCQFDDALIESPPPLPDEHVYQTDAVVLWLIRFILVLQAKYYITDACINALLKFLCVLFKILGFTSARISSIAATLPSSIYKLKQYTGDAQKYITFVVCAKCHQLYKFKNCLNDGVDHDPGSKTCSHIRFPNLPQS